MVTGERLSVWQIDPRHRLVKFAVTYLALTTIYLRMLTDTFMTS